jgi:hypothetical protein
MTSTLSVVLIAAAAFASASCGSDMITQPQDVTFPDTNVSYRGQVQPFLTVTCATGGCHSDIAPAGGIRLGSYSPLFIDRPNLVVVGRPDESLVMQVLTGVMPHLVGNLPGRVSANHRQGMRQWILEGARNN